MNHVALLSSGYILARPTSGIRVIGDRRTRVSIVRVIARRSPLRTGPATSVYVPTICELKSIHIPIIFKYDSRTNAYHFLHPVRQIRQCASGTRTLLLPSVDASKQTTCVASIRTVIRNFPAVSAEPSNIHRRSPFRLDGHRPLRKLASFQQRYVEADTTTPHRTSRGKHRRYRKLP
jgi:hypothetical protein